MTEPADARRRSWYWAGAAVGIVILRLTGLLYDRHAPWFDPLNQLTLGAEWVCLMFWYGRRQWAHGYEAATKVGASHD